MLSLFDHICSPACNLVNKEVDTIQPESGVKDEDREEAEEIANENEVEK